MDYKGKDIAAYTADEVAAIVRFFTKKYKITGCAACVRRDAFFFFVRENERPPAFDGLTFRAGVAIKLKDGSYFTHANAGTLLHKIAFAAEPEETVAHSFLFGEPVTAEILKELFSPKKKGNGNTSK